MTAPTRPPEVVVFTIVGEALLLVWLLVKGHTIDLGDVPTGH